MGMALFGLNLSTGRLAAVVGESGGAGATRPDPPDGSADNRRR
jgi:hypothetical protein